MTHLRVEGAVPNAGIAVFVDHAGVARRVAKHSLIAAERPARRAVGRRAPEAIARRVCRAVRFETAIAVRIAEACFAAPAVRVLQARVVGADVHGDATLVHAAPVLAGRTIGIHGTLVRRKASRVDRARVCRRARVRDARWPRGRARRADLSMVGGETLGVLDRATAVGRRDRDATGDTHDDHGSAKFRNSRFHVCSIVHVTRQGINRVVQAFIIQPSPPVC